MGSDPDGRKPGVEETSLWDGMGEGAISRNTWPKWDRGPLPGSFEREREGEEVYSEWGLEGEPGPQDEGLTWGLNGWPVPPSLC